MRLLMMFGPMLFRQYKKSQKNKEAQSREAAHNDQSRYEDISPEEPARNNPSYREKDFV